MSTATPDSEIRLRLQRLWKGTLFVAVGGAYIALLAGALILFGWKAALLAVFLVLLGQCFRYIANDIDRLGWAMASNAESKVERSTATQRDQTRLLWLLGILVLAPSAALIVQAQYLGGGRVALVVGIALGFVEALYVAIRRVNRRTAFQEASYGLRDRSLFSRGPDAMHALSPDPRGARGASARRTQGDGRRGQDLPARLREGMRQAAGRTGAEAGDGLKSKDRGRERQAVRGRPRTVIPRAAPTTSTARGA